MSRSQRNDGELDRLLARGELSRPEKERILGAVLQRTRADATAADRGASWLWRWRLAFAAATVALLAVPGVVLWSRAQQAQRGTFATRGGGSTPVVEVSCRHLCARGDTLVFRVHDLKETAFLAAFALDESGARIWYFPTDDGEVVRLEPSKRPQTLKRGVRIGSEHPPGVYRIHLVLSRRPLDRKAIRVLRNDQPEPDVLARQMQKVTITP